MALGMDGEGQERQFLIFASTSGTLAAGLASLLEDAGHPEVFSSLDQPPIGLHSMSSLPGAPRVPSG